MWTTTISVAKDRLEALPSRRQLGAYIAVGCAAGLTHVAVVVAAVEGLHIPALIGNVLGFAVAFFVSFAGHSRLTFPIAPANRSVARTRFFLIASSSFALNQIAYAVLLHVFGERLYLPLLAVVLLLVAVVTFIASKRWAFAGARGG